MNFTKSTIKFAIPIIMGAVIIFSSSCKKDEDPKQEVLSLLEGAWEVRTFTEDGVESMGWLINNFEMEYEEYQTNEGDFKWTINYDGGATDIITGEYECNAAGDELELIFRTGDTFEGNYEWDMTLDEDDLVLESTIDGFRYIIKSEK